MKFKYVELRKTDEGELIVSGIVDTDSVLSLASFIQPRLGKPYVVVSLEGEKFTESPGSSEVTITLRPLQG